MIDDLTFDKTSFNELTLVQMSSNWVVPVALIPSARTVIRNCCPCHLDVDANEEYFLHKKQDRLFPGIQIA